MNAAEKHASRYFTAAALGVPLKDVTDEQVARWVERPLEGLFPWRRLIAERDAAYLEQVEADHWARQAASHHDGQIRGGWMVAECRASGAVQ